MFQYSVHISTQLWTYPESDEYVHYIYIILLWESLHIGLLFTATSQRQ